MTLFAILKYFNASYFFFMVKGIRKDSKKIFHETIAIKTVKIDSFGFKYSLFVLISRKSP